MKLINNQLEISTNINFENNINSIQKYEILEVNYNSYEEFTSRFEENLFPPEGCIYRISSEQFCEIILLYSLLPKKFTKFMPKLNKNIYNGKTSNVLYIGKSLDNKSIKSRIRDHFQDQANKLPWGLKLNVIAPER